jgi:hypothetical protein
MKQTKQNAAPRKFGDFGAVNLRNRRFDLRSADDVLLGTPISDCRR